jgi:hypothetical protein
MHLPLRACLLSSQLQRVGTCLAANAPFDAGRQSWHPRIVISTIWMILPWLSEIITAFLERALQMLSVFWGRPGVFITNRSESLHLVIGEAVHRNMFTRRLLTALIKQVLLISRHGHFVLTTRSSALLLIHKLLFPTSQHLLAVVYAWADVLTRIRNLVSHHLCVSTLSDHAYNRALICCRSWRLVIRIVVGRWGSYNTSIFALLIHTILNLIIKSIGFCFQLSFLFIFRYLVSKCILYISWWVLAILAQIV